jgi:hypothetical protein
MWFYKPKRHKTVVYKKEVMSGVSKTPKKTTVLTKPWF